MVYKKEYLRYLTGILTFFLGCAAVTWFFQNIDELLSPKMVYMIRITCTISFTIMLAVGTYYGLRMMYQAIFLKDRFETMGIRLFWGGIGLAMVLFQYYAFDFPVCLPRTIKGLISILWGDGSYC